MMPASSDAPRPRYRIGDVIAGKYRLSGELGAGGMGTVWAAINLQLEAPVAIKLLLRPEEDRERLTQRLRQEAKAAARLGHSGIVRIFDVDESELGDAFIVMELLKGESLGQRLSRDRTLPPAEAVQLLLPVADALSVAHAQGIIHRDLKPDNVFIVDEHEQLQPKLVDFGIAKFATPLDDRARLTQGDTLLGSPEYMSPEQARGLGDIDHRTDVWSFCVMLYELLSGQTPFSGSNYNALLRSIVEDEPLPLVPAAVEAAELWPIIRRGLEKERDQRFPSMNELGRELASWLIRRGVYEDACGSSLEAKWTFRSSDRSSARSLPPRARFSSWPTEASGVRRAEDVSAHDPTLEKPAEIAPASRRPVSLRAKALIAAGVLCALGTLVALFRPLPRNSPSLVEPRTTIRAASSSAPVVAPSHPVEPPREPQIASSSAAIPAPQRTVHVQKSKARQSSTAPVASSARPRSGIDLLAPY